MTIFLGTTNPTYRAYRSSFKSDLRDKWDCTSLAQVRECDMCVEIHDPWNVDEYSRQ